MDRITALRELDVSECFDLLATVNRGRLAITYQALPAIVPVHLKLTGDEVVVASLLGRSVVIVTPNIVALETGNLGEGLESEWTVQVCGFLRALKDDVDLDASNSEEHKVERFTVTTDQVRGWSTL